MSDLDTAKSVFLSSSKDWRLWYSYILQEASQIGVLSFIDLDKPDRIIDVKMPEMPTIQPNETKSDWDMRVSQWNMQMAVYNAHRTGVARINSIIWRTVSSYEMSLCPSGSDVDVKDILRSLQRRLAPTLRSRQFEVRARYKDLCKTPRNQDIEKWLDAWIPIERDIRDAGIIDSYDLVIDFLNANIAIDVGWVQACALNVKRKLQENEASLELYMLVMDFKERYREMRLIRNNLITVNNVMKDSNTSVNASASTNTGANTESKPPTFKGRTARGRLPSCVCGSMHSWAKCYYLNPSKRLQGWQEDAERRKKVNKALENEDLRKKIDAAISKATAANKDMVDDKLVSGMALRMKDADIPLIPRVLGNNNQHSRPYLRDSWVFDTGAEQHICNNRSRFLTFQKADAEVYTGDSRTWWKDIVLFICSWSMRQARNLRLF
ncbi:hypothetical protein AJ78_01948 [Emergomyces pasteurianus Ep9510]|uniref:Uncharacterized protein n=1 Tax=Emergomyces pasteurianus Ep9510 TaxID=1447872 RepID=A0A1J9QP81_9EURO|nr:hypothetical protein AJ78_01948 [Emergomyces pasteurianus Ep9510]